MHYALFDAHGVCLYTLSGDAVPPLGAMPVPVQFGQLDARVLRLVDGAVVRVPDQPGGEPLSPS